ncbi:MAG: lactate utilization protein [Anaerolineae bacterium]|nr:lactate utilization protein [Anaerolineae bacterium]MDW8099179.1 lactate utilization protein [Anaerolineae bacterium]
MNEVRQRILNRLTQALHRYPPVSHPRGLLEQAVTQVVGGRREWIARFGQELERLGGAWEYMETVAAARLRLLSRFQTEQVRRVLSWSPELLPLPGLSDALSAIGVEVIVPDFRARDRMSVLQQATEVDWGITGAEAALANTGTVVVRSGPGFCRLASLITPKHLALVPVSRLYPNLEAWLAELRKDGRAREFFADASNVTFISGPSRTADIEMTPVLGVHGPRQMEVLLFEER